MSGPSLHRRVARLEALCEDLERILLVTQNAVLALQADRTTQRLSEVPPSPPGPARNPGFAPGGCIILGEDERVVWCVIWTERERGRRRQAGCSLHQSREDALAYIAAHWISLADTLAEPYPEPDEPTWASVGPALYGRLQRAYDEDPTCRGIRLDTCKGVRDR